jgi:pimeloyl-ACP methyl ester carboxylesterase
MERAWPPPAWVRPRSFRLWATAAGQLAGCHRQAATELRRSYTTVLLTGNSFGAALALAAAAHLPVDGLVLFAPYWRLDSWLDALYPLAERLLPSIRPFARADFKDIDFRRELTYFLNDVDFDDPATPGPDPSVETADTPRAGAGAPSRPGLGFVASRVKAPVLHLSRTTRPTRDAQVTQRLARRPAQSGRRCAELGRQTRPGAWPDPWLGPCHPFAAILPASSSTRRHPT